MTEAANLPVLQLASGDAWEDWLRQHYADSDGVWLQIAKKGAAEPSVSYDEALDVALCYGWIDGQKRPLDDQFWLQRFSPRRARSIWSKRNRDHVVRLIAEGRMQPAGMQEVERAQADGRWEAAYDSQRTGTVPADFQQALDERPAAKAFFATISSANRYALLFRLQTAKKPETRAARLEQFITMLEAHETLHPERRR